MFEKIFNSIKEKKEIAAREKETKILQFEKNTPGIEVISDVIVSTIVDQKSTIVINLRNNVYVQHVLFDMYGMKYIPMNTRNEDIKNIAYSFMFAEQGKSPLPRESVELFRDLIMLKLKRKCPWMKVKDGYVVSTCYDRSIAIYKESEIPESFFGNF